MRLANRILMASATAVLTACAGANHDPSPSERGPAGQDPGGAQAPAAGDPSSTTPGDTGAAGAPGRRPILGGTSGSPGAPTTPTTPTGPTPPTTPDPATVDKLKAEMLTTFWENDTTVFQYAFARNNHDGYGYTTGRIGFTTATGDTAQVVQCFDAAFGTANNPIAKYESALTALRDKMLSTGQMQGDTSTLDAIGDFVTDWHTTANDSVTGPAFDACQDGLVDSVYWNPALAIAQKWGLTTALSNASLYDAIVVHGEDNVNTLARGANNDVGNTAQTPASAPLSRADESSWLSAFNARRMALLDSSSAWSGAIARGANYEQQRRNGNFDFDQSITTDASASVVYPGKGYSSGSYQACVIAVDGTVSGPSQCTAPVSN